MRTTRSVQVVINQNDGELPNNLLLQSNERLRDLIFDFTSVRPSIETSTKELVAQILQCCETKTVFPLEPTLTQIDLTTKRKLDETPDKRAIEVNEEAKILPLQGASEVKHTHTRKVAKPRWLVEMDPLKLAEMKRILLLSTKELYDRYTSKDLIYMWSAIGMKHQFPTNWNTSKDDVIQRMKTFASRNLQHHHIE